ncbi:sulfite exporter TauE/SafE family protein [Corynebacterium stationis]|uniref:sulfite exporter TauE/SafE family protein n=1 Tax=Corynebacterium stationis TaxID=1705 RepID=UPI00273CE7D8|nr:sulfite exporter TauE/SafE family protein [Corynebacterium stationis]WLP86058.1 sulfite exporter TauE/SafE family protein [Corynebacterium stationis]
MDIIFSHDALPYIFLGLIILVGATVQGVIGFGLGTISTPIMALLKPDLVPVVVLCLAFIIACSTLHRAWAETDWKMVLYSNIARLPGTFLAAWALAVLSTNSLQLFIGCAVIFTMVLSSLGWTPKVNAGNTVIAGVLSGFLGTSTSIGGPPMALLMKTFNPAKARGTLAATFVFGSIVSMVTLALGGQVTTYQLKYALIYLPLAVLGLVAANYFNRFVDRKVLNRMVVIVSIGASIVLIAQSLVG